MYFNGENLIRKSIKERKEILSNIPFKEAIITSIYKLVSSEEEIIAMFEKSRDIGHEGLVPKRPTISVSSRKKRKILDKAEKGTRYNRCSYCSC